MVARALAAYLEFSQTGIGLLGLAALSLAGCVAVAVWAYRGADPLRRAILVVAGILTIIVIAIYGLEVATGRWAGAYFKAPLIAQAAPLLPLALVAWLAWLRGYSWLAAHSRHPLPLYAIGALLLVPLVIAADRAELSQGQILVAQDGMAWTTALMVAGISLFPIVLFEMSRRILERDLLP